MLAVVSQRKAMNYSSPEDQIVIKNFPTAGSLKQEIRQIINRREKANWSFSKLITKGAIISLVFEHKDSNRLHKN